MQAKPLIKLETIVKISPGDNKIRNDQGLINYSVGQIIHKS